MSIKTTWQDALFGRVRYDDPCIYFVGPEIDGERFCCYIGQTRNPIGYRLMGHDAGHNSNMPDFIDLFDNPAVELFSPDEIFDLCLPVLDEWSNEERESIFGNGFGCLLRDILNVLGDEDKIDYAEYLALYFFAPGLNVMLSGQHIIKKYADKKYWGGTSNYEMIAERNILDMRAKEWDARRRKSPLYVERGGKFVENFSI